MINFEDMMIYERIKYLRKNELNITQDNFAKSINVSRSNIGNIEVGRINITDRVIQDICSTYNVNEEWLKNGSGEIFNPASSVSFDDYAKQQGMTDLEKEIISKYLELSVETRKEVMSMLKTAFSKYPNIDGTNKKDFQPEHANMSAEEIEAQANYWDALYEKKQAELALQKQDEHSEQA